MSYPLPSIEPTDQKLPEDDVNDEQVHLCTYGDGKAVKWCDNCTCGLCESCGFIKNKKILCNECYQEEQLKI